MVVAAIVDVDMRIQAVWFSSFVMQKQDVTQPSTSTLSVRCLMQPEWRDGGGKYADWKECLRVDGGASCATLKTWIKVWESCKIF